MESSQASSGTFAPLFTALDFQDSRRLLRAVGRAETAAAADITCLFSGIGPSARSSLRRGCAFAHRAILLFPTDLDHALGDFSDRGLSLTAPIPSVLVRRRLCARYGLSHEACDVSVTRVRMPPTGVELEMFLFPKIAPALDQGIIDTERAFGFEDHLAFEVHTPDERTLERLMTILQHDAGLVFEGGGHNPNAGTAGSTVAYFVRQKAGLTEGPRFERFELYCYGDFSTVIDRHPVDQYEVGRIYSDWAGTDPSAFPTAAQAPTANGSEHRPNINRDDAADGCGHA